MHDSQLKGLQKKFENLRNRYILKSTVERETVLQKSLYYIDDW